MRTSSAQGSNAGKKTKVTKYLFRRGRDGKEFEMEEKPETKSTGKS